MTTFEKLRLYHAALAVLAIAAYLTGEAGLIHAWMGYGVAGALAFRVGWGILGPRQVGIARMLPDLAGLAHIRFPDHPVISRVLIAGILVSLLVVSGTGIALDRFQSLSTLANAAINSAQAVALPRAEQNSARGMGTPLLIREHREHEDDDERGSGGWIKEVHETAANLMLLLVGLHVAYLLAFKRKLAAFMLFQNVHASKAI